MEKSYKLIVARYNEDISWVDAFENYQIYNKGEKNLLPHHLENSIQLPNVGRESHTYLHHIINNYHNLEDVLIFCQGSLVGHTYYEDINEFKKHALDIDELGFSTNLSNIAGIEYGPAGTGDNSANFTLSFHHDGKLFYVGPDGRPKDASVEPYTLGMWWERITGEPYVKSQSVYWGGTFSVKKEFILKRSLESYMRIFGTLCGHKNPLEGHFCERSWFNILNLPLNFRTNYGKQNEIVEQDSGPKFDLKEFLKDWDVETLSFKKQEEKQEDNEKPKIKIKFKDYETYKSNQIVKNKQKIKSVYVSDKELKRISADIKSRLDPKIGMCHGSRNGYEVFKFKELLGCEVLGTDISDSARRFGLLQHDFHEIKEDWKNKFDFIYTNSLDHAYDPDKAIENWTKCLSEKGLLYIEHTDDHAGEIDFADCFSAGFDEYVRMISKSIKVIKILNIGDYFNKDLGYLIKNTRVIVASNFWEEEKSELLSREDLLNILDSVENLMFQDEETVRKCTSLLKENAERWATSRCPAYRGKYIVSKQDLEEKDKWYVDEFDHESMNVRTSGTTSGKPFEYKRWHKSFHKLEWDYHYNVVLNEFDVCQNPHILYFFATNYKKEPGEFITTYGCPSELAMNNHGSSRTAIVHYVNYEMYTENQEEFFKYLFEYIKKNPIDVFFTSSPQVNSLCNYIKKFDIKEKIAYLLSNTNEMLLQKDARFLLIDNNYFDHICDHMKCWDGGAMFFTCKFRNYHLADNVCWSEEIDGKLVNTDYFNLASPFVRYWNGDFCSIDNKYKRCKCGRLYRNFEFLQSRPFSLKGVCLQDIKEKIKALDIADIRQVRCSVEFLDVITNRELSAEEKQKISSVTDKFEFKFHAEQEYLK
jgi:SAM-dependent methyltransferase